MSILTPPILTIELIPEPLWGENLRKKHTQSEWDLMRRACYAKANYRCELCGGVGPRHPVECHEIWEYDDVRCIQRCVGVIALCPACHEVKHYGYACRRGRERRARAHLKDVNGWDEDSVTLYIEQERDIFLRRSEQKWTTDMTWSDEELAKLKRIQRRRVPRR